MSDRAPQTRRYRRWLKQHWIGVVGLVFGAIGAVSAWLTIGHEWAERSHDEVSHRMTRTDECARGNLNALMKAGRFPARARLGDHAKMLAICDHDYLMVADKPQLPSAFAQRYAGCIVLDDDGRTLKVVLNREAVCRRVDPGSGSPEFYCDGTDPDAQRAPEEQKLRDAPEKLPRCDEHPLFFEDGNRPGPKLED